MAVSNPQDARILHVLLRRHAAGVPALQFDRAWQTYGELRIASERAAAVAWHDWGVRPGDRVAWLGANHPAQIALLFGLAQIGAMLLPLNFRLAPAEWRKLLADCTPRHLVHDADWAEPARDLAASAGIAAH